MSRTVGRKIHAAAAAALLLVLWLLASPAWAGSIAIMTEGDVPTGAERDAQTAAVRLQQFFTRHLGMSLDRDVRIIIVADREAYVEANIREYKVSEEEAERRARTTRAWSQGRVIIQNAGDATLVRNQRERIFNIAHELVHQYQSQVSGGRHTRIEWLSEGTADAIAAKVLAEEGLQTMAEFRAQRIMVIEEADAYPSLTELDLSRRWYDALKKYGSKVTYRVADIAVLELLKQFGYGDLFAYFSLVRTQEPADAFAAVFKKTVTDFARDAERALQEEIGE